MLRLRVLRLVLPILFFLLLAWVWVNWAPRDEKGSPPPPAADAPRAGDVSLKEFAAGSAANFEAHAKVFESQKDGGLHLEGIHDLEIERPERGPLLVDAGVGDREGPDGRWRFGGVVKFREPESGLELTLPTLDVDHATGEARSRGDIRFATPDASGEAQGVVYGLRGQPSELSEPRIEARSGRARAARAILHDGLRDVELVDQVHAEQDATRLTAQNLRLVRDAVERLRQANARGTVDAQWPSPVGGPGRLHADRLDARWDAAGEIEFLRLEGDALVARGEESLSAASIEALRDAAAPGPWAVVCTGGVYLQGRFAAQAALLRAERVQASLTPGWLVQAAEAHGTVSFESPDTRAEAEQARLTTAPGGEGRVRLEGQEPRKARLARDRTRVAAQEIEFDLHGTDLAASGRVEATLLPAAGATPVAAAGRLFLAEQAIHFVSDRLRSTQDGQRLTFEGAARGWQQERSLAAESVAVNQAKLTMEAHGSVSTRLPREQGGSAAAEGDYIQIGADQFDYDDQRGLAVYTGHVLARLDEGWLEAERVEVELASDSRRIHEIRAASGVRVEFHRDSSGDLARPVQGSADRLQYQPQIATVVLYGDKTPAAVRRIGDGGGTTTGRVLRYRLDTGALDVEAGEQGLGRIRS